MRSENVSNTFQWLKEKGFMIMSDFTTDGKAAVVSDAIYYAVVPSQGLYGSGESVRAASVHRDRRVALTRARRATARYREAMRPYGSSSGGYRVVECYERRATDTYWLGHSLDRIPSVQP